MTQRFKPLLVIFAAVVGLLGGAAQGAPAAIPLGAAAEKPLVLLISIDGFKPSYLSKSSAPNLFELANRGMMAQGLISAFPSVTFPNHVTIVTGQTPDHHGIVNNTMTDPGTTQRFSLGSREAVENPFWWQESKPIWIAARKQGKVASTLFWPGSETTIDGLRPNDWLRYDHDMSHETRIKTLVGWLSRPPAERPDFATLYFADVDSAGHSAGPDSQAVQDSVKKVDDSIGELSRELKRLGLLERTTWIIVSDHGMASSPVEKVVSAQGLLANFPAARWEWLGALAGVRLNGASSEGVMQALSTLPHASCWPKADLPKRYRFGTHRRIPEIVCLAEVGYSLTDNPARKGPLGQHGYDPEDLSMHGLLIVAGNRIQSGTLGLVNNLEIYGLMCRLLGITPERHDGEDTLHQQVIKN
jgi:ectonucleotide pyrophosphatase/phosphodiesterase family protein 5